MGLLLLSACGQAQAASLMCHIHLSADDSVPDSKPRIIWNVGDQQTCAAVNAQDYASRGRCHCSFAISPQRGAMPPAAPSGPPEGLL